MTTSRTPSAESDATDCELTDAELAAIEQRCQAATPGPWRAWIEGRDHDAGSSFIGTAIEDIELHGASAADYDFIAHARQDVPRLVAEVRRLRRACAASGSASPGLSVISAQLAELDALARDGSVVVVKVDGGRTSNRYTIVISGPSLGDEHVRRDGDDLAAMLGETLADCRRQAVGRQS